MCRLDEPLYFFFFPPVMAARTLYPKYPLSTRAERACEKENKKKRSEEAWSNRSCKLARQPEPRKMIKINCYSYSSRRKGDTFFWNWLTSCLGRCCHRHLRPIARLDRSVKCPKAKKEIPIRTFWMCMRACTCIRARMWGDVYYYSYARPVGTRIRRHICV